MFFFRLGFIIKPNGQRSVDFFLFDDVLFFGVFMAYHRLVIGLLRERFDFSKRYEIIDVFERVGKNLYKIFWFIISNISFGYKYTKE